MKRIVCFHLFNDYSGSPKVLKMVLEGFLQKGFRVDLVSSKGGVLDELGPCKGFRHFSYPYRFSANHVLTLLRYTLVQLCTFLWAFRYLFLKDSLFYINTLLPAGPAFAGWLMRKKVVYHYHENAQAKGFFYQSLCRWMEFFATEIVCVSDYQRSFLKRKEKVVLVPNALPEEFVKRMRPDPEEAFRRKKVLMLGSLKRYKGAWEFVELARRLPQFEFELVINDRKESMEALLAAHAEGVKNLAVHPQQKDVVSFYNRASLVLNLSNKNLFVETFGLTALEAMAAGLPVIVPTVGGIAEMVEDGVNGYKIDVQDISGVAESIENILTDRELYLSLAGNALKRSEEFCRSQMMEHLGAVVHSE